MKTYTATRNNHGVGSNFCMYLVGKDERSAIVEFYDRKCQGAKVLSIVEPTPGNYHVEHGGRDEYIHRGARGEGIETIYEDNFFDFQEIVEMASKL